MVPHPLKFDLNISDIVSYKNFMNLFGFLIFSFFTTILAQCPARCPSCTKCDARGRGCIEPRDFVTCTKSGVSGVCFAGTCNTQITLPTVKASNRCQTYSCPVSGTCTLINAPDGTDCTPSNAIDYEAVCIAGACKRIWLGVGEEFPLLNIGCVGRPNGDLCDTNEVFTDGEQCVNSVCKFPNGNFYGYLPA